jgi:hypothetical protein
MGKQNRTRAKGKPQRKTFLLDGETLSDLALIQEAYRATSETQGAKAGIRLAAKIIRQASKCKRIVAEAENDQLSTVLDVPRIARLVPVPVAAAS